MTNKITFLKPLALFEDDTDDDFNTILRNSHTLIDIEITKPTIRNFDIASITNNNYLHPDPTINPNIQDPYTGAYRWAPDIGLG